MTESSSFFEQVGGHATFHKLTTVFYEGVATDPVLKPMYPEDDMEGARERLQLFLEQYWGGPTTYSDTRGHPRLRMRHMPFHINPVARERWLAHMTDAVNAVNLSPLHHEEMMDYVTRAATAMVNTFD